jgi:hypothetical protein
MVGIKPSMNGSGISLGVSFGFVDISVSDAATL